MALTSVHRKRPAHHKKAHGAHHRHSKDYLKAYHPYLPLLVLVIVGLAINAVWTARTGVFGATSGITSTALLQKTNLQRQRSNQKTLRYSPALSSAAQAKANDMARGNYWSHISPDGAKPWQYIQKSGYDYRAAGENLAYGFGSASGTVTGWMNSPKHRANLLSPSYRDVGFGVMTAKNYQGQPQATIVVAMYGQPAMAGAGGTTGYTGAATIVPLDAPARNVSRVQLLTGGQAPWSYTVVLLMALVAGTWFVTRHVKAWKRVLVESEEFIVHHKMLDYVFVLTVLAGFILSRTAGFLK